MTGDVDRILIPRERIADRIRELGEEISNGLASLLKGEEENEVVLVPVLTGSVIFLADLIRQLPHKVRIHMVTVSSYPGRSTTSQGAGIVGRIPEDLRDKHTLIVDDILDSGATLRLLRAEIERQSPRSLQACVLLRKKTDAAMRTPCEYVGFDIPNEFVIGYGLDYDGLYRNLPDIGVLKPQAMRDAVPINPT